MKVYQGKYFVPFFLSGLFFIFPLLVKADERILSFNSAVTIQPDSSLLVSETIRVRCERNQIKHGIYRDFPTRYKDRYGNKMVVDFEVLGAERDGVAENFRIQNQGNGVRIYLGRKEVDIPPGVYTYEITYKTTRQLGFFKDHDELYWNVTGNGWSFPIDSGSCQVYLPPRVPKEKITFEAYTGSHGSQGRSYKAQILPENQIYFETTRFLAPNEGLTIVVSFPKGFIQEPSVQDRFFYILKDNRDFFIAVVGFLIVFIYYLLAWLAVGKDPAKGTLIPLFKPPSWLSPAAMRFLINMGFDNKVFTAAVVSLAVKGAVKIEQEGDIYTIRKGPTPTLELSREETILLKTLLANDPEVKLKNTNHSLISKTINAVQENLKTYFEKEYFKTNFSFFLIGVLISLLAPITIVIFAPPVGKAISMFMSLWLSIWTVGVFALLLQVWTLWRKFFRDMKNILNGGAALFLTLFSIPFLVGEIFGIGLMATAISPVAIGTLLLTFLLHIIFFRLLKAPTLSGRKVMDEVEGFKLYLTVAEADELKFGNPPHKTPQLFEKYLPYALALDVETAWTEKFSGVLAASAVGRGATGAYHPLWYRGPAWTNLGADGFTNSLGGSFSDAISSSSTAPGSSSGGGGGGSSGGGGGGGGGGGW